ncbi:hypothetical protein LCGC14_2944730, partial [marine sediment metagenome]
GSYNMLSQDIGTSNRDLASAWGFNELDGYFYALRPGRRDLYRIDASGTFTDLANLPGSAFTGDVAGDILPDGTMVYIGDEATWQLIDLGVPTAPVDLGTLELDRDVDVQDIAYNPTDGFFYGINQTSGRLFRVSANGGSAGSVAVTEIGPAIYAGIFGSIWFDADGRLYGYSNTTNNLFLIDPATGEAAFLAASPVDEGGDSDGASCRGPAPIPFGAIAGNVYNDTDGSDTRNNAETNLGSGIRIDLYIDNGTATLTDDSFLKSVETAADGTYRFDDLLTNQTYRVQLDEADPDLGGGTLIGTSNPLLGVAVAGGSVTSDQDFGFDPSGADLSITKIAAATGTTIAITEVSEGDVIDWIITVANAGAGSPSGVKVI